MNAKVNFKEMVANWWRVNVLGDDPDGKRPTTVDLANKILESFGMYQIFKLDMYDVKRKIYYNEGSVGFALELLPQTGSDEDFVSRLVNIISSLPAETGIQLLHIGTPVIDDDLQAYLDMRSELFLQNKVSDFAIEFAKNRIKHVQTRKGRPKFAPPSYYVIKKPKLVLSVTRSGNYQDKALVSQMEKLCETMASQFTQARLPALVLTPRLLLKIVKPLLDPDGMFRNIPAEHEFAVAKSYPTVQYNPLDSIKTQLTPLGHMAEVRTREIVFGPKEERNAPVSSISEEKPYWEIDDEDDKEVDSRIGFRAFGITGYPKTKQLWEMGDIIGSFKDNSQQYPCPFIICTGIYILDKNSSETTARVKHARAKQNAESKMAKWQPEYAEIYNDWDAIVHHLHKNGAMCELYNTVGIFAPVNELDNYSQNVINIWKSNQFNIMPLELLQLPLYYISMPMVLSKKARDDLKKLRYLSTKTTINAIDLMPLISEWQGFGRPVIMTFGRRGVPCFFDLFSNKAGNYNFYICGTSGAGKSVFSLEILAAYKSLGYKIYILDVGRSFKNFVALSKGQTIDFAKRERICMNPFSWLEVIGENEDADGEFTLNTFAQEMKMLLPMFAKMASPEQPLDSYEKALLSKAINVTWEEYGQENGVDQISDYLKTITDHTGNIDPVGWRLGTQLESFKTSGMYGSYFNGKANIDLNNDTIYLELEELKDSPELKTVVLFGVTNRIMRDMYLSRKQGKVMFIDEAWQLLDDTAETAAFIEEGYRRARKYNGSFGMGTQGIDDAFKNDAARAAYNSADWKFYLRQDLEVFEKLIAEKKANFPDHINDQIRSLDTQGGMYSEVMVTSPNGKHIVRHLADPFSLAMASTNADDYTYIEECMNKGMTTVEAVYALMAIKEEAA